MTSCLCMSIQEQLRSPEILYLVVHRRGVEGGGGGRCTLSLLQGLYLLVVAAKVKQFIATPNVSVSRVCDTNILVVSITWFLEM